MKRFFKRLEDTMAAAAFAEAGEFETAKELMKEKRSSDNKSLLKNGAARTVNSLTVMAITYAEAGDHDSAAAILQEAEDLLREIKESYQKKSLVSSAS